MFGLGPAELLLIFLIVFLLFGARKLPELARGLGKAIREFKKASTEVGEAVQPEESQSEKTSVKKAGQIAKKTSDEKKKHLKKADE